MEKLREGKGYAVDMRTPGIDEVALGYANDWFGPSNVEKILSKLHRSEVTSERMRDDIMQYDIEYARSDTRGEAVFQMAVQSVREQLIPKDRKLIPLTLGAVEVSSDFPKDRSPGLPWIQLGYSKKRDCLEDPKASAVWRRRWDNIGRGRKEHLPDTAIYFRAQIANVDENKIRGVWGLPIDVVVEEARYFYPYLRWMKEAIHNIPIAYQVEMATGGMEYINQMTLRHGDASFICGDWSRFDKGVPPWLIKTAFQIMFDCFDFE